MRKRMRVVSMCFGLAAFAIVLMVFYYFQGTWVRESAAEIYNQKIDRGYEFSISRLRSLRRQNPFDSETNYWLASLLIEHAKEEGDLDESLSFLSRAEKAAPGSWVPQWSRVRRLQAYGRGMEILTSENNALGRELQLPTGDAQIKDFANNCLSGLQEIDRKLKSSRRSMVATRIKKSFRGDEIREDLLMLKNLLEERWAYVAEKQKQTGKSLDDLLAETLSLVQPQMTFAQAMDVFTQFIASLEDGHTFLAYDGARFSLPFRVVETDEGLIISETAGRSLDIQVGDQLRTVDGESAIKAVEARLKRVTSSTVASRHAAAVQTLQSYWSDEREYRVLVERNGQVVEVDVKAKPVEELPWSNANQLNGSKPWITTRQLSEGVAYMKVSTWWPLTASGPMNDQRLDKHRSEIDAAVAEVNTASDLILDLRDNQGGSDRLCSYLASYYVPDPMKTYVLRYRISPETPLPEGSDGFHNAERTPAVYPRQPGKILESRIWILMNAGCFSATDTMLNILTRNIPDRVRTIGRPNGAGIGGPAEIGQLRNTGGAITCSTCKAFSTEGDLLEGHPVEVNKPVQWTRADILSGTDPDLEAALKMIADNVESTRR